MKLFLQRHAEVVTGVLSGFDRLVLRGSLRLFVYTKGLLKYLCHRGIKLKDFGAHSRELSERIIAESLAPVEQAGRPVIYLPSSRDRKEDIAREIAQRDRIEEGTICVLKTVELCRSCEVAGNPQTRQIELRPRQRKCLHLYHYLIHPLFGFMHVRLQTWYPFDLQVCLNGREWLARQLDKAGVGYVRQRNCFTHLDNLVVAQRWMDQQVRAPWKRLLGQLVRSIHPLSQEFVIRWPDGTRSLVDYYWTTPQTEWASDVLRFFGRRVKSDGQPWSNFAGEITSDVKTRAEGVRIKHRVNGNTLKVYDKESVLRFEATLYQPRDFRVFRRPEGNQGAPLRWMPLRQSLADLKRRVEVSQAANERLMDAQAAVETPQPLKDLVAKFCQPVVRPGSEKPDGTRSRPRRFRALHPLADEDARLLTAVSRPEFAQNGFRNRDLRPLLFSGNPRDDRQRKCQSAAVSRKLALLRAHGLIRKVPHTHRYVLSEFGRQAITALLAARNASVLDLAKIAA